MARPHLHRRGIRRGIAAAAVAVTGAGLLIGGGVANASSHREAPLIAGNPQVDNTDVYAFVSPDKANTVTLVGNWIPFEEPNGGPNFYPFKPGAHYDINIDNNGDARPDITYRWIFASHYKSTNTFLYNTGVVTSLGDSDLNFTQTYDLQKITHGPGGSTIQLINNAPVAPSDVGPTSMPDYAKLRDQAVRPIQIDGGGKSFAGQADDPFFLDLRVFDLLYGPQPSPSCFKTHNCQMTETSHDTLAGYNVNTIALQVPRNAVAMNSNAGRNPVIGVYSTTDERSMPVLASDQSPANQSNGGGDFVQVSRLANPLVNEVVNPLKDKDKFNHSQPAQDTQFLPNVTNPIVPQLIQTIYGVPAPATPRNDLVEVFLTGICKTPTPCQNTTSFPVQADLNSQLLNRDVNPADFKPAEEMRLNMSVPPTANPNRLGVLGGDLAGFPNGRRLTDDVVDIELAALEGALPPYNSAAAAKLGDGVNANDKAFGATFPYVALPHDNSVNVPGDGPEPASTPGGNE